MIFPMIKDKGIANQFAVHLASAGQVLEATRRHHGTYWFVKVTDLDTGKLVWRALLLAGNTGSVVRHFGFIPRPHNPPHHYYIDAELITYVKHHVVRSRPVRIDYPNSKSPATALRLLKIQESHRKAVAKARLSYRPRHKQEPSAVRPSPQSVYGSFPVYYESGGVITTNNRVNKITYSRSWTGTRTPGYFAKRKGDLPVNAHHVAITRVWDGLKSKWSTGPLLSQNAFILEAFYQGEFYSGPVTTSHDASVYNRAIAKLRTKSEVDVNNIIQDCVELNQFNRMVGTTTRRLVSAYEGLKNRNIGQIVRALWGDRKAPPRRFHPKHWKQTWKKELKSDSKTLADNWLELQYGWKPLLQDVIGAAEGLAKLNLGNTAVQVATVSASGTLTTIDNIVSPQIPYPVLGRKVSVKTTKVRVGIRYKVDDHLTAFLNQTGFTNPVNLAWEVLPFSFVVDWFLPIGQYLEGITSWQGMTFLDGFQTSFTRENTYYDVGWTGSFTNNPAGVISGYCGTMAQELILLDRIKLLQFPNQMRPEFKNPFTLTHSLNGLALLRTVFS